MITETVDTPKKQIVTIKYEPNSFSIWMRTRRNNKLTWFPRKLNYLGTLYIKIQDKQYLYSIQDVTCKEKSVSQLLHKIGYRCSQLNYNELPEVIRTQLT